MTVRTLTDPGMVADCIATLRRENGELRRKLREANDIVLRNARSQGWFSKVAAAAVHFAELEVYDGMQTGVYQDAKRRLREAVEGQP